MIYALRQQGDTAPSTCLPRHQATQTSSEPGGTAQQLSRTPRARGGLTEDAARAVLARLASEPVTPPGRASDGCLQRLLRDGHRLQSLSNDLRQNRSDAETVTAPAFRLRRTPLGVAMGSLLVANQTSLHASGDRPQASGVRTPWQRTFNHVGAAAHGSLQPGAQQTGARRTGRDCVPGNRAQGMSAQAAPPIGTARARRSKRFAQAEARDVLGMAAAEIEKDYAFQFSIRDIDVKWLEVALRSAVDDAVRAAKGEPFDMAQAKMRLDAAILNVVDGTLYLDGRKIADDTQITVMTRLRLQSYAALRAHQQQGAFLPIVHDALSGKNAICVEFITEKLIYLLTGAAPEQVAREIGAHLDELKAHVSRFDLPFEDDADFRLLAHEFDRTLRMLQDPTFLSGEVQDLHALQQLEREIGPLLIKRLEKMTYDYWSGVPNSALLDALFTLNENIAAYAANINVYRPDPPAKPSPAADKTNATSGVLPLESEVEVAGPGAHIEPFDLSLENLGRHAIDVLNQTGQLYHPILEPEVFIDKAMRQGLKNFEALVGRKLRFTPTTKLFVRLMPEPPAGHHMAASVPRTPITRYYTLTELVTQRYLYDVADMRDPVGRKYYVVSRGGETLLNHLSRIDFQGDMERELKRYREDAQITAGNHRLIHSMVVMRCLQYLEHANDRKTVAAVTAFLQGTLQAHTVRFYNVPLSGAFHIPVDGYTGLLLSIADSTFYLTRAGTNTYWDGGSAKKHEHFTEFDQTPDFQRWVLNKIPYYDAMRLGDSPEIFNCKKLTVSGLSVNNKIYYCPLSFAPCDDRDELVGQLHTQEMDRLASNIDTLVFSDTEQRLTKLLQTGKDTAQVLSLGLMMAVPGASTLVASAVRVGASLAVSGVDIAASAALSAISDRPHEAGAHYNEAMISGVLQVLLALPMGRQVANQVAERYLTISNVDFAIRYMRSVRNRLPEWTQKALARGQVKMPAAVPQDVASAGKAPVPPAASNGPQSGARDTNVVAVKQLSSVDTRAFELAGMLPAISQKTITTRLGKRTLEEIKQDHIDGVILSTYRIDMGKFYVYTLQPRGIAPTFTDKQLTFTAHGSYFGRRMRVRDLVAVPPDVTVSYLTPAGLALSDPGLGKIVSFVEVLPFIEATQSGVKLSAAAAGRYGKPFDIFGHSVMNRGVAFREQYFSNFPYDNDWEVNRALIRNYKYNKVAGKMADIAVVKPRNAMTLTELLDNRLGHQEIMLSTCRIFAVPNTLKVQELSPSVSKQVYSIMRRAYDEGGNSATQLAKKNIGKSRLDKQTYRVLIAEHDAISRLPLSDDPYSTYTPGKRLYSNYELLRVYKVEQNGRAMEPPKPQP